jgi:hypothetical protein
MRSTEWLPASRPMLGFVPHPAWVAPRVAIGDRGRWANKKPLNHTNNQFTSLWQETTN